MTTATPTDDPLAAAHAAPDPVPVALTRGPRRSRRRRERTARQLATVGAALATLVVVVAAAFAVSSAISPDDGDDPLAGSAEGAATGGPVVARGVALLVQRGDDGSARSLTLLTADHVVLVPPGAMAEVPSFGLDALGRALALGGPALLRATTENLLGVTVDDVVVVDDVALAALVRPAGDLEVDVPRRVEQVTPRGAVEVLWDAGPTIVPPGEIGRLLAARGEGNDLARLARHQAFWEAWLAQLGDEAAAVPAGELAPYLEGLRDGDVTIDVLPVEAVDGGGADELYRVREAELDALVRRTMPGAASLARTSRPRVQILNGTGAVGLAQEVTLRLVQPPLRARVLYTGNADSFAHPETQVVIYDRDDQAIAERVRAALGAGRVVLSRRPLGIVDVTVVVGRDFR